MAHTQRREARQIKRDGILGRVAGGNHLVAENDEPEPFAFTEEELLAADVARMQRRDQRFREQLATVHELELAYFRRMGYV